MVVSGDKDSNLQCVSMEIRKNALTLEIFRGSSDNVQRTIV